MKKIKAIVVDDEEFNRRLIIDLIHELNDAYEIEGEADSVLSAFEMIMKTKPDIVFLDIKMPDGSGFELLNMFGELNFEVVFITGFDSYALKAFEFNALDYILKPIEPEKFAKTLVKVQTRLEKNSIPVLQYEPLIKAYDAKQLIISKVPIHVGNMVILLDIDDIIMMQATEGCTSFRTTTGEKYLSSKQLGDFEFILSNYPFIVKANKSTFINLNHILQYSKGMTCMITMKDNSMVEVSRRKKSEILEMIALRS